MGQAGSSQRARPVHRNGNSEVRNVPNDQSSVGPVTPNHESNTLTHSSAPHNSSLISFSASEEQTNRAQSRLESGDLEDSTAQVPSTAQASTSSYSSRRSRMSRLGTRILPNTVLRGLLNSGEETPAEGRAHRTGLLSGGITRSDSSRLPPRFSSFRSLGSRGINRRRSIRGPYALPRGEAALLPESPPNPTFFEAPVSRNTDPSRLSWRYRTRLSNVRHSISTPISHLFGQSSHTSNLNQTSSSPPRRPSRVTTTEDSDHVLPPLPNVDTRMEFDEPHELDSVEPAVDNARSNSLTPSSHQAPTPPGARRQSGTIRSRATRLLRREEQTPLSRVLHLAATAIAAQLSGNTSPTIPSIQAVGSDNLDGPLESILQGLQQATAGQGASGNSEAGRESNVPHVNFLRVFRFVNPDSSSTRSSNTPEGENADDQMDIDGQDPTDGRQDRRLLTLVVVGVRSVPPNNGQGSENASNTRLNVESLLRLPHLAPSNFMRNDRGPGSLLRRSDGRSRFSPRRYSVGSNFPSNYDSQRHHRSQTSSRRQSDAESSGDFSSSIPTPLSDSPQGPNAPPSTPAEPGRSGVSSAVNTPSRRPSSASAILPQLDEVSTAESDPLPPDTSAFNSARQRRRSDSEAARHRGLGSGAARRNGVVEPDEPSPSTGRSWLIYVVGTNLAENHPAFATPSLFTDNPTYEDMILLSSLLGPAKPPVASEEEIASAGGLYQLTEHSGALIAESQDEGGDNIPIVATERCLICLCDYEAGDVARLLNKCKHLYHRECIDEWLITGRNSCPLCRGEGVSNDNNSSSAATATTTPERSTAS